MRGDWRLAAAWVGVLLGTGGACWLVWFGVTDRNWGPELGFSLLLLALNGLGMALADLFRRLGPPWDSVLTGMGLVAAKLFVNTFTIFLLIGLQAVRSTLFVAVFFTGYLVLQAGSICLLQRSR